MPKIRKNNIEAGGKYYEFEIWYKSGTGFSIKEVPEFVRGIDQMGEFHRGGCFSTESHLMNCLNEFKRKYEESIKQFRFIIAIKPTLGGASLDSLVQKKIDWAMKVSWSGFGRGFSGFGFGFSYKVLKEVTIDQQKIYFSTNKNLYKTPEDFIFKAHLNEKEETVIEWTEEREKALIDAQNRITDLAEKVLGILSDPEKAVLIGQNNLLNEPG